MKQLNLVKFAVPSLLGALVALGCATTNPSPQLVDARRAYDQARMSEASQLVPAKVYTAKQALDKAEKAHKDDAGSFEEKSLAYIAERQSQLAVSYAGIAAAQRDMKNAQAAYDLRQQQALNTAQSTAARAQNQLATQTSELEKERTAHAAAERRAAAALASLSELAKVKEEARGTVMTLDGSVLFVTGKSELLPIAREKLEQVAKALKDLDSGESILIEGHTDSQGADSANLALSQARADSVREFLISRGVPQDKVRSIGRGEQQPVASNDSPEGRANNRRVEIVVQNTEQAASSSSPRR
jgi:outer membrane protein OmpA-like peptidoglycan-associated protein